MKCNNCQTENPVGSRFCIKCGTALSESSVDSTANSQPITPPVDTFASEPIASPSSDLSTSSLSPAFSASATDSLSSAPQNPAPFEQQVASQPQIPSQDSPAAQPVAANAPELALSRIPAIIIGVILKPVTVIQQELPKFNRFKPAALIAAFVAAFAFLFSLVNLIISTVYIKNCGLFSMKCTHKWDWSNLKKLDFIGFSLGFLVGYVVAISVIAAIFYGVSRLLKSKSSNFYRILSLISISIAPSLIGSILSVLLSKVNPLLGSAVLSLGLIYGTFILFEGITFESGLTGDKKIYYIILGIIATYIVFYILMMAFLKDQMKLFPSGKLPMNSNNLLDLLK